MQRFGDRKYVAFALYPDGEKRSEIFQEIAYFSYNDNHEFFLDERSLRYYYPPNIGADLSKGFQTFQQLDDTSDDHLDGLLKTIIDLEKQIGTTCAVDIITWRGMMTKIMAAPFDNMNGYYKLSLRRHVKL